MSIKDVTLGEALRAVRWGRVALSVVVAAGTMLIVVLGGWFEKKTHAQLVASALAQETAKVAAEVREQQRAIDSIERRLDYLIVSDGQKRAQDWLIADHLGVQRVPAPAMPGSPPPKE